jgi:hypothetical protein
MKKNPLSIDKTNLIIDNGKIRNCVTNLDKMSIYENMIFDFKDFVKKLSSFYVTSIKESITGIFRLLWVLFCTLTFPIILFIRAIITKYQCRKEINEQSK